MENSIAKYAIGRDNNFNLIRFIAASLVLYSHSYTLTGHRNEEPLKLTIGMTWGHISVDVFFIISGFLITSSYFSKNNLFAFIWARVLRIYPALIASVVFCVFVVGLCFTTNSLNEYLLNPQIYRYFFKDILLLFGMENKLPGVFSNVPFKNIINGSLWTLPYEVRMYAILAFILSFIAHISKRITFLNTRNIILFIAIFSTILHIFNHFQPVLPLKFIRLFSMFFTGAMFFIWKDRIRLSSKWTVLSFLILLISSMNKEIFFIVYCLVLPFIVFYLAYAPSGSLIKFNRFGDYSYGIYIYAFPIQQSVVELIPNVSVNMMIVTSFFVTLFLSFLSWHLIEKKSMKMKEAYVHIEKYIQIFFIR